MTGPSSLPSLRELVATHQLNADRRLGQHFLMDANITAKIARAAGDLTGRDVLEIGPGPGGLTRQLLAAGARRVVAVERDSRCLAALEALRAAEPERLRLMAADAREHDGVAATRAPRAVVAKLPYNVATPLMLGWLADGPAWEGITILIQKEVAERLAAAPGGKQYGRLSVMAGWRAETRRLI